MSTRLFQIQSAALQCQASMSRSVTFILLLAAVMPFRLYAGPGSVADKPLFLEQAVKPNIFFVLDDSGSMDWEVLKSNGALAVHGTSYNSGDLDFTPNNDTERRELCVGYNVLAYDPNVTYTPWRGNDYFGNPFQDQDPGNAHVNPYTGYTSTSSCSYYGDVYNYNGRTCDLLANGDFGSNGAYYYPWNDAVADGGDGDGEYDNGECPTDSGSRIYVKDLTADQQVNFANWFSYYRKREYVMKRAVSQIVEESTARMGIATINRQDRVNKSKIATSNTYEVGTPVADIDDLTVRTPAEMSEAAYRKKVLMDNLVAANSSGSTPLRAALNNTGRYFQGVNSSSLFGFTAPSTPNGANGSSPILGAGYGGECQQNFAIMLSDGYWNGSYSGVGNVDGDYGKSYADSIGNTLADVAMHYYVTDLIDGLDDDVPRVFVGPGEENYETNPSGYDDKKHQHLVTFTVAFGIKGVATCDLEDRDKTLVEQNWPEKCDDTNTGTGWPNPFISDAASVDDMRHAAWNGRGQFLNAGNPQELIDSLQAAIDDIGGRDGTAAAAAVAVNASSIQDGAHVYQAEFYPDQWAGDLIARALTDKGVDLTEDGLVWSQGAGEQLSNRDLAGDPRIIITYNPDSNQGVAFDFPLNYESPGSNELSAAQVADLLHDAPYPNPANQTEKDANEAFGNDLVDFLKGDRTHEGGKFRNRGKHSKKDYRFRLGDIVNSAPVYVGNPDPLQYPDLLEKVGETTNSYRTWANITAYDRVPMLYVGSNDGMLHAFEAETGRERFAFIPNGVFSSDDDQGLHWLADKAYDHRYYVDLMPTITEAFIRTPDDTTKKWRTILVGSLRGGGKALYALDISDPSTFVTQADVVGNVLWEFTDNDLGYTFSQPVIAKLNNGDWGVIVGNGYNSDPTGDGTAKLLILDLYDGSVIKTLETKVGLVANNDCGDVNSECNGLASPAVIDLNGDGRMDRVYAGDLEGNMWVFDISNTSTAQWGPAYGSPGSPVPLFVAKDQNGNRQPITTKPALTKHTSIRSLSTKPNLLVFFGTGQYIADEDTADLSPQSFFGVWDNGSVAQRSDLLKQEITTTGSINEFDVRVMGDVPVDYSTQRGWHVDFPSNRGERVVVYPIIYGNLVVYTTIIPDSNLCGSAGDSWLMVHEFIDGSEPPHVAIDVDGDGFFNNEDKYGGENGNNVNGVKFGDLLWQPEIVSNRLIIAKDNKNTEGTLVDVGLQSDFNQTRRGSWSRFDY